MISSVGLMARANAEIRAAHQDHEAEKAQRARLGRPIAFIDRLINDLEMVNLKGALRVPTSYETRLQQLRNLPADTAVAAAELEKLRTRILIANLMDQLYAIRGVALQVPPSRHMGGDGWMEFPKPCLLRAFEKPELKNSGRRRAPGVKWRMWPVVSRRTIR